MELDLSHARRVTPLLLLALGATQCGGHPAHTATVTQSPPDGPGSGTPGPLPQGFNLAAELPTVHPENFGLHLSMATDEHGDPMLAFYWIDPNNDGQQDDTGVYFVRWNRDRGHWTVPARVAVTGNPPGQFPVAIAVDRSNGTVGIAYSDLLPHQHERVLVAFSSDHGDHWNPQPVVENAHTPTIVLGNGTAHVFSVQFDGVHYRTGAETAALSTWPDAPLPTLQGTARTAELRASAALDANGQLGVAYWNDPPREYNRSLAFWRPGRAPVLVFDTQNRQNDGPSVSLAFHGTEPVVTANVMREDRSLFPMMVAHSADGVTFSPPAVVTPDGPTGNGPPSLVVDHEGHAALAYEQNGGTGTSERHCGHPKLAHSADLTTWVTCSPDTSDTLHLTPDAPVLALGDGDVVLMAFRDRARSRPVDMAPGLYVWRER